MATDLPSAFQPNADAMKVVGYDMSALAARKAFAKAGIKPTDVQVVELHDCFSANELITYEALGLCEPGKGVELVRTNNNTYGGKYVVNPSGGLISKGHPLGATGLAQCSELSWQLRGEAEKRQVPNVKYALQHNIGLGGAAVVGVYALGFPNAAKNNTTSSGSSSTSSGSSSLKSATSQHKSGSFFDEIESRIKTEGASFIEKINATIGFSVACAGGKTVAYVLDLKNKPGSVFVNDGSMCFSF
jgi:sterol carrier protein 2